MKGSILRKRGREAGVVKEAPPPSARIAGDDDDEPEAPLDFVGQILQAELAEKKQRQATKEPKKKGKVSFNEEDGSAEKAAAVEKAAAARRAARKGGKAGDTELALHEEALAATADEGEFEPFNLDAERASGRFDADGNYVEEKEEKHEEDAWLDGVELAEDKAELCRREAEAEAAVPTKLSDLENGRLRLEIASLLRPGETVLTALKRMGGGGARPGGGGGGARARGAAALLAARASSVPPEHRAAFDRLTELSSTLMGYGEYDVYTFARESFERAARAMGAIPVAPGGAATAAPSRFRGGGGDDDDDDMFADEPPAKKAAIEQAGAPCGSSAPDFSAWSITQLSRFLKTRGLAVDMVEKRELVAAVVEAASKAQLVVPSGYTFHSASGFYTSAASPNHFWDLASGLFADSEGGWHRWDADTQSFMRCE